MKRHDFTFTQKTILINYLFELAKIQEEKFSYQVREDCSKNDLMLALNYALEGLDVEGRRIITSDFKHKARSQWWYGFYSRSTYYRLKSKAMKEFLDCLHE